MGKTRVKASFIMEGDKLEPYYVSEILELTPTKSWCKDEIFKNNRKRVCGSWTLSIDYEESNDITIQINKLCSYFVGKEQKIKFLKEKYCGIIVISVVIEVENHEVPGIVIEDRISKIMSNMGADIDIDIYLMS